MFEKYDINDLYLAIINVTYPDPEVKNWDESLGNFIILSIPSFRYFTILKKDGYNFIDLQNPKVKLYDKRITTKEKCSYIQTIEPLSNYYTKDGKKKNNFSKKSAIKEAKKHYEKLFRRNQKDNYQS